MSMTSLSVILAVLTSNINHRGLKGVHVPRWLKTLLNVLSKVMCMKLVFIKQRANNTVYQGYQGLNSSVRKPYHYVTNTTCSTVSGDVGCLKEYDKYENGDATSPNLRNNSTRKQSHTSDINKDVQLILQKLDTILAKEEEKDHSELLVKQWVEVAEVVDRFFFWLFVIGTGFASLFLLFIYPRFKPEAQVVEL